MAWTTKRADGWVLNYNLFRDHEGIDNDTPEERAKVKPPFTEWADVVKLGTTPTIGTALKAETPSPKVVAAPKAEPQSVSLKGGDADRKPGTSRGIATMPRVSLPKRCKATATARRPRRNGKKAHPYAKFRNAARQARRPRYPRKRAA